jgi:glutathione S-transferase|tara:strand:- start:14 stop:598 length:585 start_codon:yes stop_codon:yes gene_type:complete
MVLKLFGGSRTRASMPLWYMEEKSIDYELVKLDLQAKQHRGADFLGINPFGKLPALIDGNTLLEDGSPLVLFESGAILLHLAERYSNDINTPAERALTSQWLLFANATLSIALFVPSSREHEFPRLMEVLNRQLEPDRPLVGDRWGVADCAVEAHLCYLPIFFPEIDLSPYPVIQALIERTRLRPAYQRSLSHA